MNFFFALDIDGFDCSLTVPKFTNESKAIKNVALFSSIIEDDCWVIEKLNCDEDKNFFNHNVPINKKDGIFFLGDKNYFQKNKHEKLDAFLKIKTNLTFRASLNIYNNKGFTSYQSEYPLGMTKKTGSIVTLVSSLINKGQSNLLAFRQIYYLPIKENFLVHLVDLSNNKLILTKKFCTNSTNIIDLTNINHLDNCCFFSETYLGIPIFISFLWNIATHLNYIYNHKINFR